MPPGAQHVRRSSQTGDFEGVLNWVIGLDQQRPFAVTATGTPTPISSIDHVSLSDSGQRQSRMTLPNVVSDCDELVGLGGAIEREHRVDDRRDAAVGEQRHDVAHERGGRGGLLLDVAGAQHGAEDA